MIIIRLFRIGKKKQPAYKIVVTDKKNPPSGGRFVDEVGFYNPITKEKSINGEKVKYWLSKGASVSDTVHNFLLKEGVIDGKKRGKHNIQEKKEKDSTEKIAVVPDTKRMSVKSDVKPATDGEPAFPQTPDSEKKGEV